VVEVVDGDTIRVELASGLETVRIIGIDTPEVHHPSQPEACFGAEATDFATRILEGQSVFLEPDPTQDERDRYGRLLAHVHVGDDLYASEAIAGGFGIHYVYEVPSIHADELDAAAEAAQKAKVGIWASCQGRVDLPLTAPTPLPVAAPAATSKPEPTKDADCHPSYDPCVPNAGHDLDCGDIRFQVTVIGPDVYRLDGSDNDGRGCESY
jgi:micrococcal nuclease